MRRISTRVVALASAVLGGCSLVVGGLQIPECTTDDECNAGNAELGLPTTCLAFACLPDGDRDVCQRIDDGERCDGRDNDCDGLIDEGVFAAAAPELDVPLTAALESLALGDDGTFALALYTTSAGTFAQPLLGTSLVGVPTSLVTTDPATESIGAITTVPGCQQSQTPLVPCDPRDVALDLGPDGAFVASIATPGCAAGQLRLGALDPDDPTAIAQMGPPRRSNVLLGVDPTPSGRCTENQTVACQDAITADDQPAVIASCGATSVAVRALDPATPSVVASQALVGWLGAPRTRLGCGEPMIEVRAAGAFLYSRMSTARFRWVSTSDEGASVLIGQTRGSGPPAIAAWGGEGYFVAFPAAAGGTALRFVGAMPEPPNYGGTTCCLQGPLAACSMPSDCGPEALWQCNTSSRCVDGSAICAAAICDADDRTNVETPSLPVPIDLDDFAGAGSTDDVVLAIGRERDDGTVEVGIAWRQGVVRVDNPGPPFCDAAGASIAFRRVVLSVGPGPGGTRIPTDVVEASPPVTLGTGGAIGGPTIAYVPAGFVESSFERNGVLANDEGTGGYFVAWPRRETDGSVALVGRRVLELDGELLDAGETFTVTTAPSGPMTPPRLYDHGDGRVGYVVGMPGRLQGGALACAP